MQNYKKLELRRMAAKTVIMRTKLNKFTQLQIISETKKQYRDKLK